MDLMKAGRFKDQSVIAHFSPMSKQGMIGRWKARCKQGRWLEVPDAVWNADPPPKGLPDYVRDELGIDQKHALDHSQT